MIFHLTMNRFRSGGTEGRGEGDEGGRRRGGRKGRERGGRGRAGQDT